MPTTREIILQALQALLQTQPAPVLRGEVLPERVSATGLLILRDGDPGEPAVTLSPLRYHYQHRAEVEAIVQASTGRDTAFDSLAADVGTLQRLPKLIPEGVARELAYTGRRMPAVRAKEVGLVNEVYATQGEMLEAVMEIAHDIASKSPLAIWGTKEMINYARDHSVADSLNYIATWQTGMFQPADMMESFAAKGEKRDPEFDDLLPNPKQF